MRTFKKIIAVLVTISMLLGAVALTASAGEAPVVVLVGRTQMERGDEYRASLVVMGEDVGGVQGTITYDTSVFTYAGVDFTEKFNDMNKRTSDDNVLKVDENAGTIAFIGLNPGKDETWFTLKFTAVELSDDAVFTIGNDVLKLKASKTNGKELLDVDEDYYKTFVDVPDVVEVVEPGQVNMSGATIKAASATNQDIKFMATINYTGTKEIAEYGMIFIPAQLLPKGEELVADPEHDYNPDPNKTVKAAIASSNVVEGNSFDLTATLTGSSSFKGGELLQVDFYARAYIKFTDDNTVLYSNNDTEEDETDIKDGYARKSIIGVAITMASRVIEQTEMKINYDKVNAETVNAILLETLPLDEDQEEAILTFVRTNADIVKYLAEQQANQ